MTNTFNENRFKQIIEEIRKEASEIEIDIDQLTSAEYDPNPYAVEPELFGTSGGYDWDEDEEWTLQCAKMIEYINADGLENYANLADGEEEIYQPKVIEWLENEMTYYN